jgi:hypothetical protein
VPDGIALGVAVSCLVVCRQCRRSDFGGTPLFSRVGTTNPALTVQFSSRVAACIAAKGWQLAWNAGQPWAPTTSCHIWLRLYGCKAEPCGAQLAGLIAAE